MGGWIKFEKDLRTDPRVIRLGAQLCNGEALQGVTLMLGGLAQLWMIADTHIGNNDVLPVGADQINQLIGVQNFCQILPPDWLQIIDSDHVKLPGYHAHNGTLAKARALNARRVANHRGKRNARALPPCNDRALPDLDLDLDLERKEKLYKKKTASRLPADWRPTESDLAYAAQNHLNGASTADAFRDYWTAAAGANARKHDWEAAFRTWVRRAGASMPPRGPAPHAMRRDDSAAWAEIKTRGAACGFRAPWPLESLGAYQTAVKFQESSGAKSALARLASHNGGP